MRKVSLTLAALAALSFAIPTATPVFAQHARVVIGDGDRGHHADRGHRRKVIIKQRHHDRGMRHHSERRAHGSKVIIHRN